ncbi:MAG: geranylgeranylglyceryl/heptaprenylglyceryl phosphate synthase [Cytophagaceae bacterium]|nr:geranylgeranylglyceryl/heptaprenylglyceryl phosphate synthase [Cytophagaceae bacterium]MDW8456959.1 geranylgeranylglyceryl/heptaprenylglyceryl phosphate synthase [Cytophagaceae bacterium]
MNPVYNKILSARNQGKKQYAVLLDPDKLTKKSLEVIISTAKDFPVDYFFVGGSLLMNNNLSYVINTLKQHLPQPVVLFPGSNLQIDAQADAILFLSLISGRNADALIGQHVVAAPLLKKLKIEVISTGYMLIDCGKPTTVSYISNTTPIPYDKPSIAACTAMAGEMLGMKLIYADGGSGASKPISEEIIQAIRSAVDIPIVAGGGIRSARQAELLLKAGADIIVTGNGVEDDISLLKEIYQCVLELNS